MRFLIHTQYYPPEIGAPQSRLSELAQELRKHGFSVSILTAMPSYPTGKIFSGYSGIFRKETSGGIQIFRAIIYPTKSISFLNRLLNYFSFILSSFLLGLFIPKPDFILTESPPLFLGITGYLLSRIKKAKWIFNVADLWPSSVAELGLINKDGAAYTISQKMESFFYRKAIFVTGQSISILDNINSRFPDVSTYHLSNGVIPENYKNTYQNGEKFRVMYAGLHGIAQGLDQLIDSAAQFTDFPEIEFVLVGDGPEKNKLMDKARKLHISNITFLDPIPKSQIPDLLSTAGILVVLLKIQLTGAVPSKLYEAMAAGKPVILVAEGEAAEIVSSTNCGLVIKPGDITALISAINYLFENPDLRKTMGENGKVAVTNNFNRKKIVNDFVKKINMHIKNE